MIDSVMWAQYINVTDRHTDSHVAMANAAPTHCVREQKCCNTIHGEGQEMCQTVYLLNQEVTVRSRIFENNTADWNKFHTVVHRKLCTFILWYSTKTSKQHGAQPVSWRHWSLLVGQSVGYGSWVPMSQAFSWLSLQHIHAAYAILTYSISMNWLSLALYSTSHFAHPAGHYTHRVSFTLHLACPMSSCSWSTSHAPTPYSWYVQLQGWPVAATVQCHQPNCQCVLQSLCQHPVSSNFWFQPDSWGMLRSERDW